MATKKSSGKQSLVSYKDVQIAFLVDGIQGVEKILQGRKSARTLVRHALSDLKRQGRAVDALESYVAERHATKARGRAMPGTGEERRYRAQQIEGGGVFLRLPLTPLGVKKSGSVRVRFDADRILVTKA